MNYFNNNGELTKESRILYAYAKHISKVDELPPTLIKHFWNNTESREQIIELYELYDAEMIATHPHLFFSSHSKKNLSVSIDWENLDEALESILKEVLAEENPFNRTMERKMAMSYKASPISLKVLTPQKNALCINNIQFVFSQEIPINSPLHFKNTQGKTIGRFEVVKNSRDFKLPINDIKQFPSGLYYWTLLIGTHPITNRLYICTEEDARSAMGE